MDKKERGVWKNLGLALAATPVVSLIGLIVITLIGALDNLITRIQLNGYWWVILIAAYILSFIYFLYEPTMCLNRERAKVVNGLILYWKEQLAKQNKPQPLNTEIEAVRKLFLERVKVWAWFDSELWARCFPNEKYSKYLFDIVDNFMIMYGQYRDKIKNN